MDAMNALDLHYWRCPLHRALQNRRYHLSNWMPTSSLVAARNACRVCALLLDAILAFSPDWPVGDQKKCFRIKLSRSFSSGIVVHLRCNDYYSHLSFEIFFAVGTNYNDPSYNGPLEESY